MAWLRRSVNYWPDNACAKAFWSQHELPPYRQLLADTSAQLNPQPNSRWLDLGCGRGMLTRAVWERSNGTVGEVIGLDCAAVNSHAYEKLQKELQPLPRPDQVRFVTADFSQGLPDFPTNSVDGIVSGLALSYAESYSDTLGRWTTAGYDRVMREAARVLKPDGSFVFSVNVPEPAWGMVALDSLKGARSARRPHRYLLKAWRIWRYGGWLKREARRGRFHYLPLTAIRTKLMECGFDHINAQISFSGQAYVISCRKALAAKVAA